MIVVADSGSTKTQWVIVDAKGAQKALYSEGINPYFMGADQIEEMVGRCFQEQSNELVSNVYFYGAGCALPDKIALVQEALSHIFVKAQIEVNSDLLASARALFGTGQGVACILGTGSNAAVYDGNTFVQQIQSVGYILGDEGSGSYIGRKLLQSFLRKEMPQHLRVNFQNQYTIDIPQVLSRVYKEPFPNRYLASFAEFAGLFKEEEFIRSIVQESFADFIQYQLDTLTFDKNTAVGFVGSIAYYFQDVLEKELNNKGYLLARIIKEPIHGLIEYHQ